MSDTPLATLTDLYAYGAPATALSPLTSGQQQAGLNSAADEAMGYFASRGPLPLTAWGADLTEKICHLAAYNMLSRIGFNPDDGADKNYKLRYDAVIMYLLRVSRGEITPPNVLYSQPSNIGGGARVKSQCKRGW